ncbi:MAG: TIGR03792 family protein [Ilumatobacteraceae bacterium]
MVIEWLTFAVPQSEQENWLAIEESVWSRFLETQPGFLRKEIWIEEGAPDLVHAVIWWESTELWKRITPDQVAEVDARMGDAWRNCTMRVFDVRRQC